MRALDVRGRVEAELDGDIPIVVEGQGDRIRVTFTRLRHVLRVRQLFPRGAGVTQSLAASRLGLDVRVGDRTIAHDNGAGLRLRPLSLLRAAFAS